MLPKRPMKVLRATLERLFEQLCQEPSNPGTPIEVGMDMAPSDHDFRQRRNEVRMVVGNMNIIAKEIIKSLTSHLTTFQGLHFPFFPL